MKNELNKNSYNIFLSIRKTRNNIFASSSFSVSCRSVKRLYKSFAYEFYYWFSHFISIVHFEEP